MKTKPKRGRPPKRPEQRKTVSLLLRLEPAEKQAFRDAADIAGAPLTGWIRERLRRAAVRELEDAGRDVPFLEHLA